MMHHCENVQDVQEVTSDLTEKRRQVKNECYWITVDTLYQPNMRQQYSHLFDYLLGVSNEKISKETAELVLQINKVSKTCRLYRHNFLLHILKFNVILSKTYWLL